MATLVGIYYKDNEQKSIGCLELDLRAELFCSKDPKRQISFISAETEKIMRNNPDRGFCHMRFKGNLIIEGLDALNVQRDQLLKIGDAVIEVTAAGKECHSNCPLHNSGKGCRISNDIYFAAIKRRGRVKLGASVNCV